MLTMTKNKMYTKSRRN
ncbi:hypothetical protein Bhyg_14939 [Pseudolycoriella hygida]|uniref:Uncharacterized protein n=1 Tax=Pseudolycoriella hygida TaxID=35572 RepID=A0A9Q0MQX2_9DIPT|nr:hypothetical protein Bhyg_14939 [Pseudolycoriella hygida]